MTEQEYLDSKNIVTEYVEDFTDRNGWKNISLTTLLKDYKQQLILTDVSQQRELLLDFLKWQSIAYSCNNDEIGNAKEVEAFFKSNNCG
jgi:hypothetical protein